MYSDQFPKERDTQSAKPIVGVFLQMPDVARGFSQSPLIRVEPVQRMWFYLAFVVCTGGGGC